MKILLVDDDVVDRAAVVRTLHKGGLQAEITEALTVDEGLMLHSKGEFDLILLDYRLPLRDGIEMILELKNEQKNFSTAIVMMSSSEDESIALECIQAGAQDFLVKSNITVPQLRRAILHATTRFELERTLFETYKKVKLLAETDPLTGLPNRYYFDESLKQAIVTNKRNDHKLALLLFDLDNFKLVNDSFGHDTGDVLLKKVVSRIKGCLRGNESFSRLGGDEFAIILTNLTSSEQASMVARRILRVMHKPVEIAKTKFKASASIGIVIYPENARTSDELFKYADIAMYRAKKQGRNQACFFENEMQLRFQGRLKMELELEEAIEKGELRLHYQPVVNPQHDRIQGFEALLRWQHQDTLRSPDEFISIAEETHQIVSVGLWVIEEALATLQKWNYEQEVPFVMAINVSALQLADFMLVDHLRACLEKYQVPAELVEIELTETALFKDTVNTRKTISALDEMGCRLSLDDFGTGFSSISHLRNYPISAVKIDKSLMPVDNHDTKNSSLIEGLVSMASILGLSIVAEGVETQEHLELCKQLEIERIQGYYYSKALPRELIEQKFLENPHEVFLTALTQSTAKNVWS